MCSNPEMLAELVGEAPNIRTLRAVYGKGYVVAVAPHNVEGVHGYHTLRSGDLLPSARFAIETLTIHLYRGVRRRGLPYRANKLPSRAIQFVRRNMRGIDGLRHGRLGIVARG